MDFTILQGGLCKRGACSKWPSGLSLAAKQSMKWGQETWISAFYKLHFFEDGMFTVGKWAFPWC